MVYKELMKTCWRVASPHLHFCRVWTAYLIMQNLLTVTNAFTLVSSSWDTLKLRQTAYVMLSLMWCGWGVATSFCCGYFCHKYTSYDQEKMLWTLNVFCRIGGLFKIRGLKMHGIIEESWEANESQRDSWKHYNPKERKRIYSPLMGGVFVISPVCSVSVRPDRAEEHWQHLLHERCPPGSLQLVRPSFTCLPVYSHITYS